MRKADASRAVFWHRCGHPRSAMAREPVKFSGLCKVCGVSSCTSTSASEGEAVAGVCSAPAPQHQEKLAHNMGMSHGHIHEFYGSFTLPGCPKEVSVQVHLPQLAGLVPARGERSLFGLPAYVRHNPHFCHLPNTGCQTNHRHQALMRLCSATSKHTLCFCYQQ